MIRYTIDDADVKQCGLRDGRTGEIGWALVSHGINIAYADTEEEAKLAREAINDLARKVGTATIPENSTTPTFERDNYLSYVGMNPESAEEFFGQRFFRVVEVGPAADPTRYKPGAKRFRCFTTRELWEKDQSERICTLVSDWRDKADELRKQAEPGDSGNMVEQYAMRAAADAYDHCAARLEDVRAGR